MERADLQKRLNECLGKLKDFQTASVQALYDGFYRHGRPRMLLADEVGLGKTVVAKGLIAKILSGKKWRIAMGQRST